MIAHDPPDPDVTVPADQAWTDTGIDLGSVDVVEITSDGKITHNPNDPVEVGPDGDERTELREFSVLPRREPRRPDRAHRCRRRRVPCGRGSRFAVPNGGRLFLGINDLGVSGNTGNFTSEVTLVEP